MCKIKKRHLEAKYRYIGAASISKTKEGKNEKYFYSGSVILYTQDNNGTMVTENIRDLSGNIIASKRFDDDDDPTTPNAWQDQYFFYHYDMRGSTTAIIEPDEGDLVEGYTYDEFGNLELTQNDGFLNETTFTGSITDTSTGLQYMNARYYDASTGRFLTPVMRMTRGRSTYMHIRETIP